MPLPRRYAKIYPSFPMLSSEDMDHVSTATLMSVRCFQAEPDTMPEKIFAEHHVLLNLCESPHRVQILRDGELSDFTFHKDEIVLTPAGLRPAWRWFGKSDVIVITLDPERVERFAMNELHLILTHQ